MTMNAVEVSGLTRSFGGTRAIEGLELSVPSGGVFGLLGPNGAGKTTTLRILATLLRPDAGTARVLGHDVVSESDAVRERISLTGQLASVDPDLTAVENLVLLGRLQGLSRSDARRRALDLLEVFALASDGHRGVRGFSGGMRRRLDVAASVIVQPELLFLDEPTTGLDPRSRLQVWDLVRDLVAGGTTVLLTTQYLDEADQLADRIAIIDHGTRIADGTPGQLKARLGAGMLEVRLLRPEQRDVAASVLGRVLKRAVTTVDAEVLNVPVANAALATDAIRELIRAGVEVAAFALGQPTLDAVFMALTGHPSDDASIPQEAVA